ncbi:MAG: NAD(P)/FAD-dependent oxidoreductase [Chitinophagales bacterium]|nr:NAD(P)/FAD-dependent oxidoreductase [Chitinophagales bacterium]
MKMNIPEVSQPRVVIVGGGFGGLQLAKSLKNKDFQVVLVDKHNYHTFQPLLYQVATAGLEPDSIAFPIRKVFKHYNQFYFRMAKVERVDTERKRLETPIGYLNYDYLVIATGSETNYFGKQDIANESLPMKSIPEALNLRSLVLQNFEKALTATEVGERDSLMNFVVIGGGPTGVELAGALAELKKEVLPRDYPDLDLRRMQIHLIEAGPKLLGAMSEVSSSKSLEFLKDLGVNVYTSTMVTGIQNNVVATDKGGAFYSHSIIWTAGVEGAPIEGLKPEAIIRGKRVKVNEFNQVEGYDNIFAIGDVAAMLTTELPKGHPMLAQVALQQGKLLGENLLNLRRGKALKPFKYKDLGTMATVGRHKAVAELPWWKTQGIIAWYLWMLVHLMALVGFRNRVVVFINWMWSYFNYDKGVRLIIRPFVRKKTVDEQPIDHLQTSTSIKSA